MTASRRRLAADITGFVWRSARLPALGTLALTAVAGLLPVLSAWFTKLVVDGLLAGSALAELAWVIAVLAALTVVTAAQPHAAQYLNTALSRTLARESQATLFAALNRFLGLARFEDPQFLNEVAMAQHVGRIAPAQFVSAGTGTVRGGVLAGGFLTSLLVISPWMAALILLATVPSVHVQLRINRLQVDVERRSTTGTRRETFYGDLLSRPDGAQEIRLFGIGSYLRTRLLGELDEVQRAQRGVDLRNFRAQSGLALLGSLVAAGGLIWVVLAAGRGIITLGDVTVFLAAVAGTQAAIGLLVTSATGMHRSLLLYAHFHTVTHAENDLPSGPLPAGPLERGIEVRDVWFRYGETRPWVLQGVDFTIPRGKTVAIAGLNGSGKSTLVKLLCRCHDPQKGRLTWNGTDYTAFDVRTLRARMSALLQDYLRYELTARENVGLGRVSAMHDTARLSEAAGRALIDDVLRALPNGYDTQLNRAFADEGADPGGGVPLSGGQWQRVGLARALLRDDIDLLILDEPGAGLDAEAERAVHERITDLRRGRTTLLISHHLGTLRTADLILVLADGQIVERGTHEQLMAASGRYRDLFELQAGGFR
ncbi:ABC transporter ATP-binding protein [Amycolatopsis balhimycina DSM 5908]|uniref:ABC transporter ATP-binding protein n=1 Tax=Amycolatopsis balhimycina DSM 5908 TaxID=1081091 RepID=A0A428WQE2_AMYBA|nr:ABC transporter ATP-binding protein [Amycolatopsis balhimycina]RSM45238.1 ABC transporter ATP-binding protein [Amycolatopsis balhimycina DSM 5908]